MIQDMNEKREKNIRQLNGISMIPFGLLAGFMNEKEIRITELAEEGFRFRLVGKIELAGKMEAAEDRKEKTKKYREKFKICIYDMEKSAYQEIIIDQYEMTESAETEFYTEYTVVTEQKNYRNAVRKQGGQYSRYIRLKLEDDDSELASALTGYPAELDEQYADNLAEQYAESFAEKHGESFAEQFSEKLWGVCDGDKTNERKNDLKEIQQESLTDAELALEVDRPQLYKKYLRTDLQTFSCECTEWRLFSTNFRQKETPDRLYIGNQFCHLLFPDRTRLFAMMEKAKRESVEITIVFSYLRQFMLKSTEKLLDEIYCWCRANTTPVEVVINDWAMADMVKQKKDWLTPSLGTLLNKRKKDPRFSYKQGNKELYTKNNLNADFYRNYQETEFGIRQYEWEVCGYPQIFPEGNVKNSLHLPFYQTNTSQYCTLYAVCTTGNRGTQKLIKNCPGYCEKYVFLYPKHLNMMGRYNSLFGTDTELLFSPAKKESYIRAGISRFVVGRLI